MRSATSNKGGRPPGRDFPHVKSFRFRDEDEERIKGLADRWGSSEAAVIRRLLQEAAAREGLTDPAPETEA